VQKEQAKLFKKNQDEKVEKSKAEKQRAIADDLRAKRGQGRGQDGSQGVK